MAMNGAQLAQEMVQAMGLDPVTTPVEYAAALAKWTIFGNILISHIINNATVYVASVSGVTVGAGTSGSGAGTIKS